MKRQYGELNADGGRSWLCEKPRPDPGEGPASSAQARNSLDRRGDKGQRRTCACIFWVNEVSLRDYRCQCRPIHCSGRRHVHRNGAEEKTCSQSIAKGHSMRPFSIFEPLFICP